jgi:hypothetical protein
VAKKAKTATDEPQTSNGQAAQETAEAGETITGYFRRIFKENPKLLKERSNEEVLMRWLKDHPGHGEVPDNVKVGVQNAKTALRKKLAERKARRQDEISEQPQTELTQRPIRRLTPKGLEQLEEQIDECLALAKRVDREGLRGVIGLLRVARNAVVRRLSGEGAEV